MLNSHIAPEGCIVDYCDGEFFTLSPLFTEDPCALQIQLFHDELEICNPIGTKAKKDKLGTLVLNLVTIDLYLHGVYLLPAKLISTHCTYQNVFDSYMFHWACLPIYHVCRGGILAIYFDSWYNCGLAVACITSLHHKPACTYVNVLGA